jgi:hypothetical protein
MAMAMNAAMAAGSRPKMVPMSLLLYWLMAHPRVVLGDGVGGGFLWSLWDGIARSLEVIGHSGRLLTGTSAYGLRLSWRL